MFLNIREIQNYFSKFCVSQSFDKIILNFVKFEENFAKHKIKISQIFREITKKKISQPPYVGVE